MCFCQPSLFKSFVMRFVFTHSLSLHQQLTTCHTCTDEGQDGMNTAELFFSLGAFPVDFPSVCVKQAIKISQPSFPCLVVWKQTECSSPAQEMQLLGFYLYSSVFTLVYVLKEIHQFTTIKL